MMSSAMDGGVTRRFSTEFEYKELLRFQQEVGNEALDPDFQRVLERTRANNKWVSSNRDPILAWFTEEADKHRV
ncbi:hypothetical protein CRUP_016767 [Coryphaenoides rupestris]|nr:hypothetical protein CRUP_016767 [Coryphaenoides rupestris]